MVKPNICNKVSEDVSHGKAIAFVIAPRTLKPGSHGFQEMSVAEGEEMILLRMGWSKSARKKKIKYLRQNTQG